MEGDRCFDCELYVHSLVEFRMTSREFLDYEILAPVSNAKIRQIRGKLEGKKDATMSSELPPQDVSSLFGAILESLKATAPPEMKDAILFQSMMMILGDNWAPFEAAREPLQRYLQSCLSTGVSREAYVQMLVTTMVNALGEDPDVNLELATICRDDAEPLLLTQQIVSKHLLLVVNGILDFQATPEQSFSAALRSSVVALIGEWFDGLSGLFLHGQTALPSFLQQMSQLATRTVMGRYPQHGQIAMMGIPMMMAMLQRMHREHQASQSAA